MAEKVEVFKLMDQLERAQRRIESLEGRRKRGEQGQPRIVEPYELIGPVRVNPDLRRRLDEHCTAQSVTLRAFVERAVARELERKR